MAKQANKTIELCNKKRLKMHKTLILIPARFASSRFPGKPLAKIAGKSMIELVVENCKNTGFDYSVVTDSIEIENHLKEINANYVRVDDDVSTGSERIALAYSRFFDKKGYSHIINVQGDEPLLVADLLQEINEAHCKKDCDIFTIVKPRSFDDKEFENPNIVKCAYEEKTKNCLYFSRSPIPFQRVDVMNSWYQHIGVYSYKVDSLVRFNSLEQARLEIGESLEQLRALANGMTISAIQSDINLIGVDAPEDIKKVEKVING